MSHQRVRFNKQYSISIKGKSGKCPHEEESFAVQRFEDILVALIQAFINFHPKANVRVEVSDL